MIHFIYANLIIDNDNFITLLEITVEWKITNNAVAKLEYYKLNKKINEFYKSKSNLPGEAIELMTFSKKYY